MKFIQTILVVLLFCVVAQILVAQNSTMGTGQRPAIGVLSGEVFEESSDEPIQFATVTLFSPNDSSVVTGGISDEKGWFKITEIPIGRYTVEVTFIGYEKEIIRGVKLSPKSAIELDLGRIYLSPSSVLIEDAEVTGNKDLMKLEIDKRVFDVSQSITSTGGSANEVLENIPSVEVDIDGNVSLRGSQNVTVLIDGKPSGLTGGSRQAILDQLPASSIELVEVITNPSAKYDPDGMGGIINIILKKNKLQGYSGNLSLSVATGDNYNGSFGISKRNEKYNIFANYSYRYSNRFSERETDRTSKNEDLNSILDQNGNGERINDSHNVGLGVELYISKKSSLYANAAYQLRQRNNKEDIDFLTSEETEGVFSNFTEYFRENTNETDGGNIDLNLGYEINFVPRKNVLKLDLSATDYISRDEGLFNEFDNLANDFDYIEKNKLNNTFQFFSGQLDYENKVKENWKIESGLKSTLRIVNNDFSAFSNSFDSDELVEQVSRSNNFEYTEQINAAYLIVGRSLGKLGMQLGLRGEQANTESYLVTTDSLFANNYYSMFPSGHLKYSISDRKELMLSYSRRINRPRTRQLNPFTNFSNPLQIRVGNPFLLPEYVDAVDLSYSISNKLFQLVTSLYYKRVNDVISRFIEVSGEVSQVSYQNLDNSINQGIELILTWKKWKKWNLMLSGNAYKTASDGSNVDSDLGNEGYAGTVNTNITWKNNGWQTQASVRYRAPFVILQGNIESVFTSDLALKKGVLKEKGTIGLRLSDVFNTREFNFNTSGENFSQSGRRKRESQNLYFTFSYNFGKLEKRKKKGGRNSGGEGFEGIDL